MLRVIRGVLIILLCLILSITPTTAGWLDDWFDQAVSTSPNYFEGQKRGYFTAGSFSARIPTKADYLFSIEKPRLKFGCGGIDMFLGGFSFVNFEYLVQKFQRLIQAAPIVAFQIALNTLSSALTTQLGEVEKIINALNQLQLDECRILKPFTTIDLTKDDAGKQFEAAAQAALESTGATNLLYSLFKGSKTTNTQDEAKTSSGTTITADKLIEGCPTELQSLINEMTNRSIYDYVASRYPAMNSLRGNLRAIVGDLSVIRGVSSYAFSYEPPCSQAKTDLLKESVLYIKTCSNNTECCIQESTKFKDKIALLVERAKSNALRKQAPPDEYENLVKMSPLPVHMFVRYSIVSKDPTVLYSISDAVAKGVFYQATLDMIREVDKAIAYLEKVASIGGANTSQDKPCAIDLKTREEVKRLRENLAMFLEDVRQAYIAAVSEQNSIVSYVSAYRDFEAFVYKSVSQKFGQGVASRLLF